MTSSRADLHCHSTASQVSKLGVQRALGLPECATPPEEVYALAKRRGMDFVTITDHDTIDGVLEIADRPDVFVSEELTAQFRGEPQAVHILCYGITPGDHEWLQAHAVRRRGGRDLPARARRSPARWRTPSTRSRRRCCRVTAAVWRSCSTSGRCATARARRSSTIPRRSTSRPTAASASAGPTITRASTSAAPGLRRRSPRGRGVPRARARRTRERPRRAGLGRQVGARRDGARRALARPRLIHRRTGPERGPADGRAPDDGGRRPYGVPSAATSVPRTAAPCCARGSMPLTYG